MRTRFIVSKIGFAILVLFLLYAIVGKTQIAVDSFDTVFHADSSGVRAIAEYPDSLRKQILACAVYPKAIASLDLEAKRSQAAFASLLSKYSTEVQAHVYELARYPGLFHAIDSYTGRQLEMALNTYPKDIQAIAKDDALDYPVLMGRLNKQQTQFDLVKSKIFREERIEDSSAFNAVLNNPVAFNVLVEHLNTAMQLSSLQKQNALELSLQLERVRSDLLEAKAKDLEEWKKRLDADTLVKKEFEASGEEFKADHVEANSDSPIEAFWTVSIFPYPFWFGYPWWYTYPLWYPYPYWYQMGYTWTSNGWVVYAMPSDYYFYWYFDTYPHPYHYPHFTDHCLHYYNRPRTAGGASFHRVNSWRTEAEQRATGIDLIREEGRADRIRAAATMQEQIQQNTIQSPKTETPTRIQKAPQTKSTSPIQKSERGVQYPDQRPSRGAEKPSSMPPRTMPAPQKAPDQSPRNPLPRMPENRPNPTPQNRIPSPTAPSRQGGSSKRVVR